MFVKMWYQDYCAYIIDLPNLGIIDLSPAYFATRLLGQYLHIS